MSPDFSSSTARLAAGARATLELVAAAMAGDGHLEAAQAADAPRSRPVEMHLRRLPAIIAVLLLAAVVLVGIGVALLFVVIAHAVAVAVAALTSRSTLVALR